jgi:hypothetical protein
MQSTGGLAHQPPPAVLLLAATHPVDQRSQLGRSACMRACMHLAAATAAAATSSHMQSSCALRPAAEVAPRYATLRCAHACGPASCRSGPVGSNSAGLWPLCSCAWRLASGRDQQAGMRHTRPHPLRLLPTTHANWGPGGRSRKHRVAHGRDGA